jgi:hypothetical protein
MGDGEGVEIADHAIVYLKGTSGPFATNRKIEVGPSQLIDITVPILNKSACFIPLFVGRRHQRSDQGDRANNYDAADYSEACRNANCRARRRSVMSVDCRRYGRDQRVD